MPHQSSSARTTRRLYAIVLSACLGLAGSAHGQSLTTASRAGDLQLGGGVSVAKSDFGTPHLIGYTFYSSFDFRKHFGVEADFHQLNATGNDNYQSKLYERSYEVGGRYIPKHYGLLTPYAKVMYGRGVLNYNSGYYLADGTAFYNNIAYNMFVGGGGLEYEVKPWLKVRADFEYQRWLSGLGLPNGLTPIVGTVGVAYRFGSGKPKGLQWEQPKYKAEPAPKTPRQ